MSQNDQAFLFKQSVLEGFMLIRIVYFILKAFSLMSFKEIERLVLKGISGSGTENEAELERVSNDVLYSVCKTVVHIIYEALIQVFEVSFLSSNFVSHSCTLFELP